MAEHGPRVVLVPPGGAGLAAALRALTDENTTITALEDGSLATARNVLSDHPVTEFLPFGNCIGRFAAMCGDSGLPRLSAAQSVHLVQKVAATLSVDSMLSRASGIHGLAQGISRALTDLRHHQIDSEDLEEAAAKTNDPLSADRFRQLAEFNRQFLQLCEESGREVASQRAVYCLQQADPPPFVIRRLLVICSGPRAPLFDEWLRWVARSGVEVICLFSLWADAAGAYERELAWAHELGPVEDMTEQFSSTERWTKHIFSEQDISDPVDITVMECGDNLIQCEWVVRRVAELIREGVDPPRIGIFIRGGGNLVSLLSSAAYRHGVRISGLKSTRLDANGFVSFALDLLRSMRDGDLAQLGRLCFSSYLGIEPAEAVNLSAMIPRFRTTEDDGWDRFGLEMRKSATRSWFDQVVAWRREAIARPRPLTEWAHMFHQIWARTPVLDHAIKGPDEAQQRDHKAWTLMQRTLRDAMLGQGSEETLSFDAFVDLLSKLWAQEQIIWEDKFSDVRLCTNINQLDGYDYFFALNMVEGALPARQHQDAVLDDNDRRALADALLSRPPLSLSAEIAESERGIFLSLCAASRQSIYLCYALADSEQDYVPSFYVQDIRDHARHRFLKYKRTDVTPRFSDMRHQLDKSDARQLQPDDSEGDQNLAVALAAPKVGPNPAYLVSEEVKQRIRPNPGDEVDINELVQSAVCNFRAVFNHRVAFKKPESSLSLRMLRQLPRRARIVQARTKTEAMEMLRTQAQELEEDLAHLPTWEQQLYRAAVDRMIDGWAEREIKAQDVFGLRDMERHYSVDASELEGFRTAFKTAYRFKIHYDAVYIGDNRAIAFRHSGYNLDEAASYYDLEACLWSRLHVYAIGKFGKAFMVDSGESVRKILSLQYDKPSNMPFEWKSIQPNHYEEEQDRQSLNKVMNQAVEALEGAEATPNNGVQCKRCTLGDLCRWHLDYGEQRAIFNDHDKS